MSSSSYSRSGNKSTYSNHRKKHSTSNNGQQKFTEFHTHNSNPNGQSNHDDVFNQVNQRDFSCKSNYESLDSDAIVSITSRNEMRKKSKHFHQILNSKGSNSTNPQLNMTGDLLSGELRLTDSELIGQVVTGETERTRGDREKSLKHVNLKLDYRCLSGNESSGVDLCRKLFGIMVVEYNNGKGSWNYVNKDRKLVVQGVLEDSAAYMSGRIHRGDMLIQINDVDVSWLNFTRLLNSLGKRKKVKLTLQSPRIIGPKQIYSVLEVAGSDLCLAITGKRLSDIQSELSNLACAVLYLTLVRSSEETENDTQDDVVYTFPPEEQSLTALRGLFMTLSSVLVDVVGQPASCTSLVLEGISVNVVYKQFGNDVLVFAMPSNRISSANLAVCLDAFCSLLVLLFSDVKSGFFDCDRNWLDRVLAIIFNDALGLCSCSSSYKMVSAVKDYHTVKMLNLSNENKLICDEILSEFEAMDFDNYLEAKELFSRRQYTVQGTSLFYKDYLVTSHVSFEQQRNINLFMNFHGLLTLSSRQHVNNVMVWQDLKSCTSQDASLFPAGYRPIVGRSFLMIIGLKHYYLAAVIESGGCSRLIQGQASPPPLLVAQGKATLAQLETEEVHMSQCCEDRLTDTNQSIVLASADKLCRLLSPRGRDISGQQGEALTPTISFPKSPFSRSKSVDRIDDRNEAGGSAVIKRQGSKLSYGSNDSAGSGSSTGPSRSKASRVSSVADLSGIVRSLSFLQIDTPQDILRERRLDRGIETILFSFLHIDSVEGIIITPTEAELMDVHSSLQQQVMDNFSSACQKMRTLFRTKVCNSCSSKSVYSLPTEQDDHYKEIGTLFACPYQLPAERKRQVTALNYWVVGRCWSSPRSQELYVCFHESASQALVELAFSLGFGS